MTSPTMTFMTFSELMEMTKYPTLDSIKFQRPESEDHISKLIEAIRADIDAGKFRFYTPIILGKTDGAASPANLTASPANLTASPANLTASPAYVLDGQHRMIAMYRIGANLFPNVPVLIHHFASYEEASAAFDKINTNKPYEGKIPSHMADLIKGVLRRMDERFPTALTSGDRTIAPRMVQAKFIKKIKLVAQYKKDISVDEMMAGILRANEWIKQHELKIAQKTQLAIDKLGGFYINLYPRWIEVAWPEAEDWCKRIRIPKTMRTKVWARGYNTDGFGECFGGCGNRIYMNDFECAHIRSVADGGGNELANLFPLCKECNLDMGADSFDEYFTNKPELMQAIKTKIQHQST